MTDDPLTFETDDAPLTFQIYHSADGWRWRATTDDAQDEILADSGGAYDSYVGACVACNKLRTAAQHAASIPLDPPGGWQFHHTETVPMGGGD